MKKINKVLSLLIVFSMLSALCAFSPAYADTATMTKNWNFAGDWASEGKPETNTWGDTYGNENVWRAGGWSGSSVDPALTDWVYSADNGAGYQADACGYLVPEGKPGTNYLSLAGLNNPNGYNLATNGVEGISGHFFEWTAPEAMSVDFGYTFSQSGWRYSCSYLRILKKSAGAESWSVVPYAAANNSEGFPGDSGHSRTERFYVEKGDKLLFTLQNDRRDANFSTELFYALELTATRVEESDWDFQADWNTLGKPESNSWGDVYGNENVWRAGSWDGSNANPTLTDWVYSASNNNAMQPDACGYLVPAGNPGTNYLSLGQLASPFGYNLVTSGIEGIKGHFYEWTAPKDMTVEFTYTYTHSDWRWSTSYLRVLKKDAGAEAWSVIPCAEGNGSEGYPGENGHTRTEKVFLRKGGKILFTLENDGRRDSAEEIYALNLKVKKVETTFNWDFQSDWVNSGKPEANSWGDVYGNKNVWRAGGWSGLNYNPTLTAWEYSASNNNAMQTDACGYLVPAGNPGNNYLSLGGLTSPYGYNLVTRGADENIRGHFFEWTAPYDMVVDFTYEFGRSDWRWASSYLRILEKSADAEKWRVVKYAVANDSEGYPGENGHTRTERFRVKTGDKLLFTLENDGRFDSAEMIYTLKLGTSMVMLGSGVSYNETVIDTSDSEKAVATVTGENISGVAIEGVLIIASYGENGQLISLNTSEIDNNDSEFSFSVELEKTQNDKEYKAFFWKGLENLEPIF